mmetsp:Transcript_33711/g.70086  ORF Transcript_33711/g.70086 Transcript_33711/m.70086 type:complete len:86 (-) Transcript_33711:736-993(-)
MSNTATNSVEALWEVLQGWQLPCILSSSGNTWIGIFKKNVCAFSLSLNGDGTSGLERCVVKAFQYLTSGFGKVSGTAQNSVVPKR